MPMATIAPTVILAMAILSSPISPARAHNITSILDGFPDYSLFNSYLTQTRVADEINSRVTVTCLVLPNAATSSLASMHSLAAIKNALRLLVLLDYFDPPKLRSLPDNTALATTLLQTTGTSVSDTGYVNITASPRGNISFGSSGSHYSKSVREIPYNISVLEVTAPIVFPGLFDAASAASSNVTELLEKAGCGTFARLVRSSGVIKIFEAAMDSALTVLAPVDEAFVGPGAVDVGNVSSAELVTLLQYHALPSYVPKASLKLSTERPIATMASGAYGGFELMVESAGDDVTLVTGVGRSRIITAVLDDTPVCVLTVDSLLLPVELFGKAPASAPGPASLVPAPAPGPGAAAPAAGPVPTPVADSPPAPPAESPEEPPAESPEADEKSSDDSAAAAMRPVGLIASALAFLVVA